MTVGLPVGEDSGAGAYVSRRCLCAWVGMRGYLLSIVPRRYVTASYDNVCCDTTSLTHNISSVTWVRDSHVEYTSDEYYYHAIAKGK